MKRTRAFALGLATLALAGSVAACGSSSSSSSGTTANAANTSSGMPTVTMMVGGIDKQIYLPYELAQGLGYYKKYGVNMQLSTEQTGGVGAETAMVSGQVDMAGAWYVHAIDFTAKGKHVIDIANLSGAPGEREMCTKASGVTSPANFKGKGLGVTDLGSGTDNLTTYLAARYHLSSKDFNHVAVGAGSTLVAGLQNNRIACAMTTQPTVNALETKGVAHSVIDLASSAGAKQWLGGIYPSAGVLARADWIASHRVAAQKVVDALVATMHYIATHGAADIAAHLPSSYSSNGLTTRANYITTLNQDKGQFLPDGMMPAGGPQVAYAVDKLAGNVTTPVNLAETYTNSFAAAANKLEGTK
ncbi:MAG: ABC transporter substrate-binding protein [Solirubrobacteraceae bacterium]